MWTKNFSSSGSNAAWDIYSKGNFIYITGSFKNSITFGSTTLSSLGGNDIFVAKLSLDGVPLWAKRFGGPHSDVGQSIYVDNSDNVYVGGYFGGKNGDNITIGNDTYTTSSAASSAYYDGVLVKLDSSGNFIWSRAFQSIYNNYVEDIITDGSNNVYVTGSYRGYVNFGAGDMNYVSGNGFLFIAKYDSSGKYQYAKGYGGNGNEGGRDLAFDSNGNLYLIGYFGPSTGTYSVDFGNGNLSSNGASDILLLKIDNNGNTLQALNFGSSNSDSGYSIFIDSENNIYIGGITYGTFYFGKSYASVGNGDAFIAKLNSSLNPVWIKGVGGSNQDIVLQLADFNSTIIGVGYAQGSSINFSGNYIDSDNSRNGLIFALDTSEI